MTFKGLAAHAAPLAVLALLGTGAQASTQIVNLSGSLAGFHYDPTVDGETGALSLSGLSPTAVAAGDTLSISLSLDGPLTVPAGSNFSYVQIVFFGTGFDGDPVAVNEDFTFSNGGFQTATFSGSTGTSGQLATDAVFFGQSITFDSLTDTVLVQTLDSPVTLTSAELDVGAFNVPEPSAWLLMIAGVGGLGLMLRRERRTVGSTIKDGFAA
jgi:hypothetical protein